MGKVQYYIGFDLSPVGTDVSIITVNQFGRGFFTSLEMFILKSKTSTKRRAEINGIIVSILEKYDLSISEDVNWKLANLNMFKCDIAIKLDSKK